MSLVHKERRESFNIRQGDLFRIKAGTTTYMINRDNNERLVLAKLIQPVNTPGQFEVANEYLLNIYIGLDSITHLLTYVVSIYAL